MSNLCRLWEGPVRRQGEVSASVPTCRNRNNWDKDKRKAAFYCSVVYISDNSCRWRGTSCHYSLYIYQERCGTLAGWAGTDNEANGRPPTRRDGGALRVARPQTMCCLWGLARSRIWRGKATARWRFKCFLLNWDGRQTASRSGGGTGQVLAKMMCLIDCCCRTSKESLVVVGVLLIQLVNCSAPIQQFLIIVKCFSWSLLLLVLWFYVRLADVAVVVL